MRRILAGAALRSSTDISFHYFPIGYLGLIGLVFAARGVRALRERRGGMITVTYPDRQVRVPKGLSVLEASLRFNVPHASVCGGRRDALPAAFALSAIVAHCRDRPGARAFVLARVGASADPAIRLACQLRPHTDVAVFPILPPQCRRQFCSQSAPHQYRRGALHRQHVRRHARLDQAGRGTAAVRHRIPVNRFLGAVSQAVIDAGGQPNQFVGDGMLALFGLASARRPPAARRCGCGE